MEIGVCGLELWALDVLPMEVQMEGSWKRASMRVRVPFVICSPLCTAYLLKVTFLEIGAQSGW